jgi:hypothetical protein
MPRSCQWSGLCLAIADYWNHGRNSDRGPIQNGCNPDTRSITSIASYLHAARMKNPAGNYIRADMMDFSLDRTYDVVTCLFSAIGIVRTFERLERAIACMARHVRPAGAWSSSHGSAPRSGILESH